MTVHLRSFFSFLFVSMTTLLPFNLYMNAHEYYYYKLRNVSIEDVGSLLTIKQLLYGSGTESLAESGALTDSNPTDLQRRYQGWFALAAGVACILGALINTLATNRLSNGFRVLGGHAILILALLPTFIFTFIDTDEDQYQFFILSLLFASLASFGSLGLIGSGITGLAACFPAVYLQATMIGLPIAGVFSSVLSIVIQIFTSDPILNGRIYFAVALAITTISIFCYFLLVRSEYAKLQMDRNDRHHLLNDSAALLDEDEAAEEVDGVEGPSVDSLQPIQRPSLREQYTAIMAQAGEEMFLASSVLLVSMVVFPAVVSLVQSQSSNPTWRAYFTSICCFLVFNIGDMIGRVVANQLSMSLNALRRVCWLRWLLVPLLLACDVRPRFHSPSLICSDLVFAVLIGVLAVSNGVCMTQGCMRAIKAVDANLRESAGGVLTVFQLSACLAGSIVSVAIVALI